MPELEATSMWLMRTCRALCIGGGVVLAGLGIVSAPPALGQGLSQLPVFADIVDKVGPAVVNISTTKETGAKQEEVPMPQFPPGSPFEEFFKEFFDRDRPQQQQRRSLSQGSGFVVDAAGFVVTNNHVIAEADDITVIFNDNKEYKAKLIGKDPKTDLALLKIDRQEPFPFVEWADSDRVRIGDWVVAIGNPFGLGSTVTAGIVSARGRNINSGPYDDYMQIDAAINRGNSGGPSFTLEGKVFGINTAIFSPSGVNAGIGFAIPSNMAKPVIDSLKNMGRVARGWLGVRIQSVSEDIAENLGLDEAAGALVAGVTPDGPAAKSDIQPGDVILEFDGKKIDEMRNLPRIVAETPIGQKSHVLVWRKGERLTVDVELGELPEDEQLAELGPTDQPPTTGTDTAKIPELGFTLKPISDELRQQFTLGESSKGVVVAEVDPQSPAATENLRPGDLLVEVNQEEVKDPGEVATRIAKLKEEGKKSVLLLVDRQGDLRFVALRFAGN